MVRPLLALPLHPSRQPPDSNCRTGAQPEANRGHDVPPNSNPNYYSNANTGPRSNLHSTANRYLSAGRVAYTKFKPNLDARRVADTSANCSSISGPDNNPNAGSHCDTSSDGHTCPNARTATNGYTHPNAHTTTNGYTHLNAHTATNGYTHPSAHTPTNGYTCPNRNRLRRRAGGR